MVSTLPGVVGVVGFKLFLAHVLGVTGFFAFPDAGVVFTGGVFLIGFMLAGTMADYKESEKLPGEVACNLESIEEAFVLAAETRPELSRVHLMEVVLRCTHSIEAWLYRTIPHPELFAAVEKLNDACAELERAGATSHSMRASYEIHQLRRFLTRMGVISRTDFLASGYAILETLTAVIILLLMLASFSSVWAEVLLVTFVSLTYLYMVRLIYDIDDPFEYDATGPTGAAEVELFPLTEYRDRLKERIQRQGPGIQRAA